ERAGQPRHHLGHTAPAQVRMSEGAAGVDQRARDGFRLRDRADAAFAGPRPLMRAVEEAEVLDGFGKRATEMVVTRRLNGEAASLGVAALDPEGLATGKARGIEHRHEAEPP